MQIIATILLTLLLASCASPSKNECEKMDWKTIGYNVGVKGKFPNRRLQIIKDECTSRHGIEVDLKLFMSGYNAGVTEYCSADLGYRLGRSGRGLYFPGVCKAEQQRKTFESGYKEGLSAHCQPQRSGHLGRSGESFQYNPLCGKEEKRVALAAYKDGLKEFCNQETGYAVGFKGDDYNHVCPKPLEDSFLKGYNMGLQKRTLEQMNRVSDRVQSLESQLQRKDQQIERLGDEVEELSRTLRERGDKIDDLE